MNKLTVIYNDAPQLEFDRNKRLEDHQLLYLDKMDEKMDLGIAVGGQQISHPDSNQRAQFVAANLAHAIKSDNEAQMASLCSYIAMRMPDIQQLSIKEQEDGSIEIDFSMEGAKKRVTVKGTVTWTLSQLSSRAKLPEIMYRAKGMGVKFAEISAEDRRIIESYVEKNG